VIKLNQNGDKVVDVEKDAKEIGEIVIRGNICAKGYYKDAVATKKLFAGGWLRSGDLAVWHSDNAVQIVDRAKDIIISGKFNIFEVKKSISSWKRLGGENISSVAVENTLMKHPSIIEAAVIGIPDENWGETPKAFVTIHSDKRVTSEEIRTWARENSELSRFMAPSKIEIVTSLPKTSTGKIQKKILREEESKKKSPKAKL
jgi:acyl-CoA synthetase (AMP-forming)/AMP-acid ligase II